VEETAVTRKVLIATEKPFAAVAAAKVVAVLKEKGYSVTRLEKYQSKDELLESVASAEAMVVRSDKVDGEVLDAAKELKLVIRAGAGYDNVDCDAAREKGVVVMNTPGQNSNAVAELAVGMMIYMARGLFSGRPGSELMGKTLGLLGFGAVGRRVAAVARGMGMEVIALDPYIEKACMEETGCRSCEANELWTASDYISLHIPAAGENIGCVGYDALMKMKEGATLVNTARKEVIDEDGMVKAFAERQDLKYVSDIAPDCAEVFEERFPERFYFTPKKMGAQTGEANLNAGVAAANQIIGFFENGDVTYQVNK
jgi:D-3-phosphoglycerate dehydrogenase